MRVDPDCRDPDLLAAEVRRLRAVIDSGAPTLTDADREAIERAIAAQEHRAADMHPRSWIAADIDDDCDTLRALLERTR
jgi:hypothetical protein